MAVDDRTIRVRLLAEIRSYQEGLRQAASSTGEFARNVSGMGNAVSADIERVGQVALGMSAGMTAALGLSAKAAIDWESSWAGVLKTVDGSEAELSALQGTLREMAHELPATHGEIAAVAEAAGQLGIATENVASFSRTMIDLGETTNLTAENAATAMARIANIMQMPQSEFDRLGSTVVELGNNLATTEAEITEMALRIAGAGNQVGMTEDQVLSFAAALSSVGVEAQAGGSSISRAMITMAAAVENAGSDLEGFAEVAGVSASTFAQAFRDDAALAVDMFVRGLGRISEEGGNVFGTLDELGLSEIRVRDALLRLSGAGDLLSESLAMGANAWEENLALAEEAALRYDTTAAQMSMLRNQVTDLAIDVGEALLPSIRGTVDVLGTMMTGLSDLPEPITDIAVGISAVSAGALGLVGAVGVLGPKVRDVHASLMTMGSAGQFAARAMGPLAGILAGIGGAVAIGTYLWGQHIKEQRAAEERAQGLLEVFTNLEHEVSDVNRAILEMNVFTPDVVRGFNDLGVSIDLVRRIAETGTDAFDNSNELITLLGHNSREFIRVLGDAGPEADLFARALVRQYEAGELSDAMLIDLISAVDEAADAYDDSREALRGDTEAKLDNAIATEALTDAEAAEYRTRLDNATSIDELLPIYHDLAGVLGETKDATTDAANAFPELTGGFEEAAEAAEGAMEAVKAYQEGLRSLVDPFFGAMDAMDDHQSAVEAVTAAEWALVDAQNAVDEAIREHGRRSPEVFAAYLELEEANRNLEGAHDNVVRSALDVDAAMTELQILMDSGLGLDEARDRLERLAIQEQITDEQAERMIARFEEAAGATERLSGTVDLSQQAFERWMTQAGFTEEQARLANAEFEAMDAWVSNLNDREINISVNLREHVMLGAAAGAALMMAGSGRPSPARAGDDWDDIWGQVGHRSGGGPMLPGHDYLVGEDGPERVRMLAHGGAVVSPFGSLAQQTFGVSPVAHRPADAGGSTTTINMPFNGHDWSLEDAMQMAEVRLGWALTTRNDA